MSRYLYSARLAPIGKPFRANVTGESSRDFVLDQFCLPLASRATIRVAHGDVDVGQVMVALAWRGAWIADFVLDPEIVTEDVERDIKIGQPLSPGLDIIRSRIDPATGVEEILEAQLNEVSLVRRGRIPGAQITAKEPMRARAAPALAQRAEAGGEEIIHSPGTLLTRFFTPPKITIR